MLKPIIEIEGIGKRYRIGAAKEPYLSLRDEVAKWLSPAARRARAAEEEFWALKDVSFSVEPGEALGIIGRNGAGKSTLLKILSQITPPTEGKITMRGRVGSLLEVGTGFHPELTGRENIYMNGAILGMSRKEIARKFDEIVAFAEMERFLDTPVKRYSSGMYVRLAFAVAAHLEPEILVIDEVLAVGDAQFQQKCLGKMSEVAKGGRTVLFVSHNIAAVSKLCSHSLLLDSGSVVMTGNTQTVIDHYLEVRVSQQSAIINLPVQSNTIDEKGKGLRLLIKDEYGKLRNEFKIGEKWIIRLEFDIYQHLRHAIASVGLMTHESVAVVTYWSQAADLSPGCYCAEFVCDIPLKATAINLCVGLSVYETTFYYVQNVGAIEVTRVAVGEQPFRAVGAGLLLGNQDTLIIRRTESRSE